MRVCVCVRRQIDEVVIFDEACGNIQTCTGEWTGIGHSKHAKKPNQAPDSNCNMQIARLLQYLECPQYLRKALFPKHHDLSNAGLLHPLDTPHHMRADVFSKYREGVVQDRPTKAGKGSFVDCGIYKDVQIDEKIDAGIQVTVEMIDDHTTKAGSKLKFCKGRVVARSAPRVKDAIYWGYEVRMAKCLSDAITQCPFGDKKYDMTIGTSERGDVIDTYEFPTSENAAKDSKFKHLLVVFGGVNGLELALKNDKQLEGIDDPRLLFDCYLNTYPNQGSGTIRTEEAILISMATIRRCLFPSKFVGQLLF